MNDLPPASCSAGGDGALCETPGFRRELTIGAVSLLCLVLGYFLFVRMGRARHTGGPGSQSAPLVPVGGSATAPPPPRQSRGNAFLLAGLPSSGQTTLAYHLMYGRPACAARRDSGKPALQTVASLAVLDARVQLPASLDTGTEPGVPGPAIRLLAVPARPTLRPRCQEYLRGEGLGREGAASRLGGVLFTVAGSTILAPGTKGATSSVSIEQVGEALFDLLRQCSARSLALHVLLTKMDQVAPDGQWQEAFGERVRTVFSKELRSQFKTRDSLNAISISAGERLDLEPLAAALGAPGGHLQPIDFDGLGITFGFAGGLGPEAANPDAPLSWYPDLRAFFEAHSTN